MNLVVTAGPTYEPLDQVRRLTNFSTGRLGSELAGFLSARGHSVVLLKGYYAVHQEEIPAAETIRFTTTADLRQRLAALANRSIDAVFHAAAVSDFGFGRAFDRSAPDKLVEVSAGKLPSRHGMLLVELIPTPKIIFELRDWFPRARLIGWKYQVDGTRAEALAAGLDQIRSSRTDACVVNGAAYGEGFGLVTPTGECRHAPGRSELNAMLAAFVQA